MPTQTTSFNIPAASIPKKRRTQLFYISSPGANKMRGTDCGRTKGELVGTWNGLVLASLSGHVTGLADLA